MSREKIEKNIYIHSKYFGKNIRENIAEEVKRKFSNYCDKDHGYIIHIHDKITIIGNIVAPSGMGAFFNVIFYADTLKPSIGAKYRGRVCMLFPNGIFVDVKEKLKVLLPVEKMGEYKYKDNDNIFKKGKNKIEIDSEVELEITSIKYEKQNFQCIGKLL